jgi:hypothetical protein
MQRPKLKDNKGKKPYELYPLGQIPDQVIFNIAKWIAYYYAVGKSDISGEDWGDIFAKAIEGEHLGKPVGLADVIHENMAWSVKSVKAEKPHKINKTRLISGRNSPDFSYDVTDPHENIQHTGTMVLSIWNERINIAKERYEPLRTSVLVRNFNTLEFTLFEHESLRYSTSDFSWKENKNGILEGYNVVTGEHQFSWQPHGSQFTIICGIPPAATKFRIRRPPVFDFDDTMNQIGFDDSWVTILKP